MQGNKISGIVDYVECLLRARELKKSKRKGDKILTKIKFIIAYDMSNINNQHNESYKKLSDNFESNDKN